MKGSFDKGVASGPGNTIKIKDVLAKPTVHSCPEQICMRDPFYPLSKSALGMLTDVC